MGNFKDVERSYKERLHRSLLVAEERLAIKGAHLFAISEDACSAFKQDWDHDARQVGWDWTSKDHRAAKGFNVAIWHSGRLCGLASGKVTAKAVRVDYLEGRPGDHPLNKQIIRAVLTSAEAYRASLGRTEVRLQDVSEVLIPVYERYGFTLAPDERRGHVMIRTVK